MAQYALGDAEPIIHPDAFVHPDATVIGNVTLAAGVSVGSGTHFVVGGSRGWSCRVEDSRT